MTEPIFHLAKPKDWAKSIDAYHPRRVEDEGFIHCSTAAQLALVAHELFAGENDLVLLTIDPEALDDSTLVYEDLYDLGEEFPHVYGPLPTSAVIATGPYLTHLEEGLWQETRFDREWIDRILHPDLSEVGMSGRTYSRNETLETPPTNLEVRLPHDGHTVELIDEDVALIRYLSPGARLVAPIAPRFGSTPTRVGGFAFTRGRRSPRTPQPDELPLRQASNSSCRP